MTDEPHLDAKLPRAVETVAGMTFGKTCDLLDSLPQEERRNVLRALAVRYRDDLEAISGRRSSAGGAPPS